MIGAITVLATPFLASRSLILDGPLVAIRPTDSGWIFGFPDPFEIARSALFQFGERQEGEIAR